MFRVVRWKRRTPSRSSSRAIDLPMADDDRPNCCPALVKLRASAARTNAVSELRLSKASALRLADDMLDVKSAKQVLAPPGLRRTTDYAPEPVRQMGVIAEAAGQRHLAERL